MNDEKSSPAVTDSGVIDHKTAWRGEVYERNPKATRQVVQRARRAPLVVFLSLIVDFAR